MVKVIKVIEEGEKASHEEADGCFHCTVSNLMRDWTAKGKGDTQELAFGLCNVLGDVIASVEMIRRGQATKDIIECILSCSGAQILTDESQGPQQRH